MNAPTVPTPPPDESNDDRVVTYEAAEDGCVPENECWAECVSAALDDEAAK